MGESGGLIFCLPVLSTSLGRGPVAGEDVFLTKVTGPGRVTLQTMTIGGFAGILAPFFEKGNK